MLKDEIKNLAKEISGKVIENRRHLHAHPELSFCEYETSAFIKAKLDEMEVPWKAMACGQTSDTTPETPPSLQA